MVFVLRKKQRRDFCQFAQMKLFKDVTEDNSCDTFLRVCVRARVTQVSTCAVADKLGLKICFPGSREILLRWCFVRFDISD